MRALGKAKQQIAEQINKALGNKIIKASDLVYPPFFAKAAKDKLQPDFGDLSLPCFKIAKILGKGPAEAAGYLLRKIRVADFNNVISFKVAGPYLNFVLNKEKLSADVLGEIEKEKSKYGCNKKGKNKRVMVEYSNANTHKEYHVGHLRNLCYGDAINKILSANGYKVVPVSYINDFGIHTAKTLWCYQEFYKNKKLPENKGRFLGEIYARATQELEKNSLAKDMVVFIIKKVESRKGAEYKLWKETRKWSIEQFGKIYKELDIKFSHIFYESEFIGKGMKMVENLYKKRFFKKSDGAIIVDLEKYGLGVLIFLRSDNTALYPVADLPLAIEKFKKYKIDKSIYVVDIRQSLYFKQLFKILQLLGHKQEMVHLGYEFVKLPSGMMSSRSGNVVAYEDLRARLFDSALAETKKRHTDWDNAKANKTVEKIVNGAIKFEMLKVGANQIISFDIKKSLDFSGFTAAYLQYTGARANSILKKAGKQKNKKIKEYAGNLKERKEHQLIIKLAKYPEMVEMAGQKYDPSELSRYLFELGQLFNDYYHSVPILKADSKIKDARLTLIAAISQVISNGLGLLGIEAIKEM